MVATAEDETSGVREVKSAARTTDVLEYLASRQNRPARLREMSDDLDMPRSSLYALLRTLTSRGWVRTDASGTMYTIGIRALLAGTAYLDSDPYLRILRPHLDALNEKLDETIHLGRLDGRDIVYLATRDSSQYLRLHSRVGRRLPAHATGLGKALLAEREVDLPETLEALTANTLTTREALEADLEATRWRGYAIDSEENSLGIRCFGFALRYNDPPTDAISCSVPIARLTPESERTIVETMRQAVREMESVAPPGLDVM
jgi:DNA-binding IclR family transcriptional regulator